MSNRIIDCNGYAISYPLGFHDTVQAAARMVDDMEADNVDRADMRAVLTLLQTEIAFLLVGLPDRRKEGP